MSYTLETYTESAVTTALPTAWSLDYLIPGVVGEIGEFIGKLAKAERDNWSASDLNIELAYELGDVCWVTAILIEHMDHLGYYGGVTREVGKNTNQLPELLFLKLGSALYEEYSKDSLSYRKDGEAHQVRMRAVARHAKQIWAALESYAFTATGRDFDMVLRMNLEKLQARQATGVLTGSGDHR